MKKETVEIFIADDGSKHFTEIECKRKNKQIKKQNKEQEQTRLTQQQRKKLSEHIRLNAESLDDIKRMIIEFAKEQYNVKLTIDNWATPRDFGKSISNTHNCPYINGVTNWGCKPDKPTGYPGWRFQIKGRFSTDKINISDFFRGGINYSKIDLIPLNGLSTGGGSTGSDFSCEFYIFLQDFPKLEVKYKRHQELEEKLTEVLNSNNELAAKRCDKFEKSIEGVEFSDKLMNLYVHKEEIQKQINETEAQQDQRRKEYINYGEFTEFEEQKELDELAKTFHKAYRYERNYS